MARRLRIDRGGIAYHVLNRRVGRLPLFEKDQDYATFEKVLDQAHARSPMRVIESIKEYVPAKTLLEILQRVRESNASEEFGDVRLQHGKGSRADLKKRTSKRRGRRSDQT